MKAINLLTFLISICFNLNAQTVTSLPPEEFEKGLLKTEMQLLDVRTAKEYQNGHIKNSMQADWINSNEFKERVQYLEKSRPVMIYCAVGGRSHAAAEWMRNNGFTNVVELKGGMTAWNMSNKPTEGISTVKQMTEGEYQKLVKENDMVLVDFGAEWCPPCKKMEPVLSQLEAGLQGKFKLLKIDGGIHTNIMKQLQVDGLPTFIIYKHGKESWRKQGIASFSELKAQLTN